MRVIILVGSEKIPSFIATLVRGLRGSGVTVGLYGRNLSRSEWPQIHLIQSDYNSLALVSICFKIFVAGLTTPRLVWEASNYVDNSPFFKVRVKYLYRIIKILEFRPELLHIQWASHCKGFEKLIYSRKIKILLSLRGTQINSTPFADAELDTFYRRLFPFLFFHAVSEDIKRKSLRWHDYPQRVKVIYSPVPKKFLLAFDPQRNIMINPIRILSIGRFHWIKGYSYAIEAVRLLVDQGVNVRYKIVAQGEVPGEILYQIRDRHLESHIEIVGGVSHDRVISIMKDHSVLLLPSVEEGIANVVLEAMAVGLPVIATRCGGMDEVIISNENGWLVPVRSPEAMAMELKAFCLRTSTEISKVRDRAHQTILNQFSENNLNSFKSWYTWVIGQP